ncbi:hypothetical protein BJX62DRAFT_118257 [Aspergillus germanicus]
MRRIFPNSFRIFASFPIRLLCCFWFTVSFSQRGSVVYGFWGTPDRRSADGNSLSAGRTPALPPPTSQIGQELRRISIAGRPESHTVQHQLELSKSPSRSAQLASAT